MLAHSFTHTHTRTIIDNLLWMATCLGGESRRTPPPQEKSLLMQDRTLTLLKSNLHLSRWPIHPQNLSCPLSELLLVHPGSFSCRIQPSTCESSELFSISKSCFTLQNGDFTTRSNAVQLPDQSMAQLWGQIGKTKFLAMIGKAT